jgi:hypothetical protein
MNKSHSLPQFKCRGVARCRKRSRDIDRFSDIDGAEIIHPGNLMIAGQEKAPVRHS